MVAAGEAPMWFEDDVLIVRMVGECGVVEMQMMIDMGEQLFAKHGYILFLVDAGRSTGLHPDARKLQAERLKRFIRPSHTAIFNVSTVTRVMSSLTQRGVELVTGKTYPVSFHKDEAEARASLASQRVSLRRGVVPS